MLSGQREIKNRLIKGGVGIDVATAGFNSRRNVANLAAGRALKKHVLQKVSHATFGWLFVQRADSYPGLNSNGRREAILLKNNFDTILQYFMDHFYIAISKLRVTT